MADSEDWRRQRAVELGLEPYSNFAKSQPAASNTHLGAPVPSSAGTERERPGVEDDVVAMRPPPDKAVVVDSETSRELSLRPIKRVYAVPSAPPRTATGDRLKAQRGTPKMSSAPPRAGRGVSLYLAGAVLASAAAGGAWFALQQAPPSPAPQAWIRTSQPEPAVALVALPPVAAPEPVAQQVLPAVAAVTCDGPEIVAGLRAAANDQLRRSSLGTGQNPTVTVAGVASARSKVADAGGGLTVCTAALGLRRASGKATTFDVDYAVRAVAGSRPQVVPLGFNHLVDSVAAAAPVEPASAAPRLAALPDMTAKKPSRESTTHARIVVVAKPILVSTGPLANTASTGFGLPGASTLSLATGEATAQPVVKVPRGCDQPATLSVAITCRNASLLALNAQIAAAIAALDQPRNERILARIRNRADLRFDRCQSVACVGNAYRYWLDELASVTPDPGGAVTAGRHDRETRGSTAYSENDVPR